MENDSFLGKRLAYSWTVVAMVLTAIVNFLYDVGTYGVVDSFDITGVTILYSIGTVVISLLFTVYGYYVLEWKQKTEGCNTYALILRSIIFAIVGMCLSSASLFLADKSLYLADEKYIAYYIIPEIVLRYITLLSTCSAFAFLISAYGDALSLHKM